eukprot:6278150-Amphidinium_carterae.1
MQETVVKGSCKQKLLQLSTQLRLEQNPFPRHSLHAAALPLLSLSGINRVKRRSEDVTELDA